MNIRRLPASTLVLLLAFQTVISAKPPNIVLILSDDQAYTDYSFMGHPHIETPHLDKLASESAVFRRGYVPEQRQVGKFKPAAPKTPRKPKRK